MPHAPEFPWKPFVVAALGFTLTVGALTGALDLWSLRVQQQGVPVDHHRAHAFAQLFGFLWLFTMGVSLHLAPRFFGAQPPSRRERRLLEVSGLGGVVLLVAGRLGGLVPGAEVLSVVGAALVLVAMTAWVGLLRSYWRADPLARDALHRFLLAGVSWWWGAALVLNLWAIGQALGGPLAQVPLPLVWALGLFGGTGSWVFGIFFRAGICTLHVRRPSEQAQRRLFTAWQLAAAGTALAAVSGAAWVRVLNALLVCGAVGWLWLTLRPLSGEGLSEEGTLAPRAVQAGLIFLLVFAALSFWGGLQALGVWAPVFLADATRHAFTLGGVTVLVLGFAGRMVPGFSGKALRWPRAYDAGLVAIVLAAALRLGELFGTTRLGLAVAGASGFLAFLGLALVAASLLGSMQWGSVRLVAPAQS